MTGYLSGFYSAALFSLSEMHFSSQSLCACIRMFIAFSAARIEEKPLKALIYRYFLPANFPGLVPKLSRKAR